ncbi:MAG TPA: MFS transporter [Blastocatellia bacterium]|nr:MFS transporter [Blastocatellia bacterium]
MIVVSLAVLLGSSTWFSGTAVVSLISREWSLSDAQSAWLTIAVQFGFITGTFAYSLLNLADRFSPRHVFLVSALGGAVFNACFALLAGDLISGVTFRFLTGVTLAGVYPVGMKIIASWFRSGLGWRLGVLVGALTMGTASPFLVRAVGGQFEWRTLALVASASAAAGGVLMVLAVGDGPYLKGRAAFDWRMVLRVFDGEKFRYTALGYFGHMWELYAFWSLCSFYLASRFRAGDPSFDITKPGPLLPLLSFAIVAAGALGCVVGGRVSRRTGERNVALVSMIASASLCALSGFAFALPLALVIIYLFVWGVFVVSDSPQFSALAARYCPAEYTGTALTLQNGIGFAVTVISIELLPLIAGRIGWRWTFVFLSFGPAIGAYFMQKLGEDEGMRRRGEEGRGEE